MSRSIHNDHLNLPKSFFLYLHTDLSLEFSKKNNKILKTELSKGIKIFYINNAFIIYPIKKIGHFKCNEVETSLMSNILSPVKLINFIIKCKLNCDFTFVNISSGAALKPIDSWSLYSSSKSFMNTYFKCLKIENDNINVFEIDPGVLNTNMQSIIRKSKFPGNDYFKNLKIESKLKDPFDVAESIIKKIIT